MATAGGYAPIRNYPVPAAAPLQVPVYSPLSPAEVVIETPSWDRGCCGLVCGKPMKLPQGDQFSVIAPATVEYTILVRIHLCHRGKIPFLVNGGYPVDWPATHPLSAFTTQQELQQVCDQCTVQTSDQLLQVTFQTDQTLQAYALHSIHRSAHCHYPRVAYRSRIHAVRSNMDDAEVEKEV